MTFTIPRLALRFTHGYTPSPRWGGGRLTPGTQQLLCGTRTRLHGDWSCASVTPRRCHWSIYPPDCPACTLHRY